MKTYRRHNCERRHRTLRTLARCMFPKAAWVVGEGPYAVLAWCRVLTVSLHPDLDAARGSLDFIDSYHCGGRCSRRHEVVVLEGVER